MFPMVRLNYRAFKILHAELQQKCFEGGIASQLVLKRLAKLRLQQGPPASLEELHGAVADMIPDFSEEVLCAAVRANRPLGPWSKVTLLLRS